MGPKLVSGKARRDLQPRGGAVHDVVTALREALSLVPALDLGDHVVRMADADRLGSGSRLPGIGADATLAADEGHEPSTDTRQAVAPLVERSRRGDKDAFGQLYLRYYARVFGLARFYLGDGAEDAVAETFMRAWSALPRYRPTSAPFVAWLYGIARHVVADELKRRKRTDIRDHVPEHSFDPQHDDRLELGHAITKLPTQQRQIIEMKYLLGMRNHEVAGALGKSIGAVNAQQWRALQSLKQILEQGT
jgi:RNA polymerase sigma-70 factor (ECF subfamily)